MKVSERSVNAVDSFQVNKERTFHVYLLVGSVCTVFQEYILRQGLRLSLVLNFSEFSTKFQAHELFL